MKQNFNIFIVLYNYMICIKGPYVSVTLMPRDMFVQSDPKFAKEFWDGCFTYLTTLPAYHSHAKQVVDMSMMAQLG